MFVAAKDDSTTALFEKLTVLEADGKFMQDVVNFAKVGVWEKEPEDELIKGSDIFFEILGIKPGPENKMPIADFMAIMHPEDRGKFNAGIHTVLEKKKKTEFAVRLNSHNGNKTNIRILISVLNIHDGRQLIKGAIMDENAISGTTDQIKSLEKEIETFTYSVSHDLRAPIRAIIGFTGLVNKDYSGELNDQGKIMLDTINSEAIRMGKLVDDLLSLSRISKRTLSFSIVEMHTAAAEALKEIIQKPEEKYHAKVEIKKLEPCFCDKEMISQVWSQLISNALKFSKPKPDPSVEIGSYSDDERDEIVYYIKDNGVGFDMKFYDKLFGVFQRLHSAEEFKGTGIGLAIVHKIIKRHNGRTWAEGYVNEGATFYFSLPLKTTE